MPFTNLLIAAIAALARIQAVPVKSDNKPIVPHAYTCLNSVDGFGGSVYELQIGEPYNNGVGCANVENAIAERIKAGIEEWNCDDDGYGMTRLHFNIQTGWTDEIDAGLNAMYPNVNGGINCNM